MWNYPQTSGSKLECKNLVGQNPHCKPNVFSPDFAARKQKSFRSDGAAQKFARRVLPK